MSVLETKKFTRQRHTFSWEQPRFGHARDLPEKLWLWLPTEDTIKIHFENDMFVHFSVATHGTYKVLAWTEQNPVKRPAHEVLKELGIEPHTRWSYKLDRKERELSYRILRLPREPKPQKVTATFAPKEPKDHGLEKFFTKNELARMSGAERTARLERDFTRYNSILKRKIEEVEQFQNDPAYTYCFSREQIRKLVVNAGFEIGSARRKLERHARAFDEFRSFFPHLSSGTIASTVVEGVPSAARKLSKKIQQVPSRLPKQPRIHKSLDQARYRDSATSPSVHESVAKTVDAEGQMRIELEKIHENGMLSPRDKRLLGRLLSGAETSDESIAELAEILRKYPAVLKRLALRKETLETTQQ